MKEALGLVETRGLSTAVLVADVMVKTANVRIIDIENTKGLGYMTIKISGNVGAVNAAVTAGKQIALENNAFVSSKVIPRPSDYIEGAFCQPKKEQTEPKKEEKQAESLISEEAPDFKVVEDSNTKIIEQEYKVEEKSQEVKEVKEEAIVEEEKIDEEKEMPNTENSQSEEKKVKKNSRKKKEPKKDNDDQV